jgi:alkaline phosphatase
MESDIADQEVRGYKAGKLGNKPAVDLMMGGGRCFFVGNDTEKLGKTCRKDGKDLWTESKKYGWTALSTRKEFDQIVPGKARLPLMALFTSSHMNYEIDRDPQKEPSLKEMALKAIALLEKESKGKGYFLMIEGSRIDMAAHSNDPAGHLHDILAYHEAIAAVKDHVAKYKSETVMISVSDHETGGMTLGRQLDPAKEAEYFWKPETLKDIHKSTDAMAKELLGKGVATESVLKGAGLDATSEEKEELSRIVKTKNEAAVLAYLSRIESTRARIGWTTTGHSGVDVNLYAYGEGSERLRGSHPNTDVGRFIFQQLGIRRWKQKP